MRSETEYQMTLRLSGRRRLPPLASDVLPFKVTETSQRRPRQRSIRAREERIWTQCRRCAQTVYLHKAKVDRSDPTQTVYACPLCGGTPILRVVRVSTDRDTDSEWIIRNPRNLFYRPSDELPAAVCVPAAPNALD